MSIKSIFIVCCCALIWASCNHVVEHADAETGDILDNVNIENLELELQKQFVQISDTGTLHGRFLNFSDTIKQVLSSKEAVKKWIQILLADEDKALQFVLDMTRKMPEHGLSSQFYHEEPLTVFFKRIHSKSWDTAGKIPHDSLALAAIYAADASLGMYHDLSAGRVDPSYTGSIDRLPRRECVDLPSLLSDDQFMARLQKSIPVFYPYHSLQKEYVRLLNFKDTAPIPLLGSKRPRGLGDSFSKMEINALYRSLRLQGYLNFPDSSINNRKHFDETLEQALSEFQNHMGVDVTGKLDKATAEALNIDRKRMMLRLQANLERWRWLGPANEMSKIWVNIAENRLYGFKQDTLKLDMKVCTGKNRNAAYYKKLEASKKEKEVVPPDNLETPLMKAKLTHFVANPTWHVPRSIMTKEMLPQVSKNPAWFADHNYMLLSQDGKEINPFSVNWKKVTRENWRFRVEQLPGKDNALGIVVIHFPNKYSIFMHDTPSQFAFSLDNRHVSHGCIRMEKPLETVGFITSFNVKNNYDDVLISMGMEPVRDEKRIEKYKEDMKDSAKASRLKPKPNMYFRSDSQLAVYIVYFTCAADKTGGVRYFGDGYNRDEKMILDMNKPRKTKSKPLLDLKKTAEETFSP